MITPEPILLILDPAGEEPPDACCGPTADGVCPAVVAGEDVPCAGHELASAHGDAGHRVAVPAGMDECPLPLMAAGGG
jgi:hypothetical protein